jgi:hypothetical protein
MRDCHARNWGVPGLCSYCTISTERSRGVTRDAREHYLAVFTGEILV